MPYLGAFYFVLHGQLLIILVKNCKTNKMYYDKYWVRTANKVAMLSIFFKHIMLNIN